MAEHPELGPWVRELLEAFEIPDAPLDTDGILALAGEAAHGVVRPAAPLTTYIAGYAAGLAAGHGMASEEECMVAAERLVRTVLRRRADRADPADTGEPGRPGGSGDAAGPAGSADSGR